MSTRLIGIDCGSSRIKVAAFDLEGNAVASAQVATPQSSPNAGWVERDMDQLWLACGEALRSLFDQGTVDPAEVSAVGIVGPGDGLYLVNELGDPVRPAMSSMDSRASPIVDRWRREGVLAQALEIGGYEAWAGSPPALLAWLQEFEPHSLTRTRWVLSCKDWVRFKLTGRIATDLSDASAVFTDVHTQEYSPDTLGVYGLERMNEALPPIYGSTEVAGAVTAGAAAHSGLLVGTPIATGLIDAGACALGSGANGLGQLCVIGGTFSVNEVVSDRPLLDPRWLCRSFVRRGQWLCLAGSPASTTNLEWFIRELWPRPRDRDDDETSPVYELVEEEVAGAGGEDSGPIFLPFLYGSPEPATGGAAFVGVGGWHGRSDLLRALYEGVAFNHRTHVRDLQTQLDVRDARVTGGAMSSGVWAQVFADALGLSLSSVSVEQTGALGAAICAGVAAGNFSSVEEAVASCVRVRQTFEPTPARVDLLDRKYDRYMRIVKALAEVHAECLTCKGGGVTGNLERGGSY